MSLFLDPTGRPTYGIGICDRCQQKFFLDELFPDTNSPGLMVCKEDRDVLDPYRLPMPPDDQIVLPFVRPDQGLQGSATTTSPVTTVPYTFWQTDFWATDFWSANFWS